MPTPPSRPDAALDRRRFLAAVGGVAGLAVAAQVPAELSAFAAVREKDEYPFTLGVASGDPTSDGVVLWTRLAPRPFEPGYGMREKTTNVHWRVASDPAMTRSVRHGTARVSPALGHSVHVEVEGLQPDREYYYQFRYHGHYTPVARTRTLPAPGAAVNDLTFAFVSCQDYSSGYYPSYRFIAEDDLDLVVHLGDYVYEGSIGADGGNRRTPVPAAARPAPRTLDQWRMRYALYKSDPDLQAAHAAHPFLVTWDDHEVVNDYAGTEANRQPDISALRAAAYQAYYEHQPLRRRSIPVDGNMTLYRRIQYGDLAQLDMLDGRQYRDVPPCGWGEAQACAAAYDPEITMLGRPQEKWLLDGLTASTARWNILGNNVMAARLDHDGAKGELLWHDAWDGFPAARNRLTGHIQDVGVRNAVFVTGDWHSTFVNDVKRDFDAPDSPVVATEFVGTSISTNGDAPVYGPYYGPMIGFNPHIRFFDGDRRGHVRCTVGRDQWRTDLQMVDTVSRRDARAYTHASFVVDDRVPGARRI
ncbi:alkaline phosphatase D family protein [Motilibacter aurantiacus]|uniref:alkaline phosphatase D family protein n=1 Tax=Motilibacter aurantiacus TaxID=2714955 RepID=UPI00140BCEEB|nr:alkaline phosphatase D family protein [Motilibacter aurantiacus]NHC44155.1 alkaline phosphatase [Motilibacter aurantiacus]